MKNSESLFLDDAHSAETASQTEVWWKRYMWPIFGLAAILILELTTSITISSFVFCLKFGMADFVLGRWFANHDPMLERRKACVCLQYALGAFKVVLSGTIMSAVFLIVASTQQLQNDFLTAAATTGLTALVGFFISCGYTMYGVRTTLNAGIRVWIDRSLGHKMLTDFPPDHLSELNELPSLIGALKLMETLLCLTLMTLTMVFLPVIPYPAVIVVTLVVWLYFLSKLEGIKSRISATTPEECWPELKVEEEIADEKC